MHNLKVLLSSVFVGLTNKFLFSKPSIHIMLWKCLIRNQFQLFNFHASTPYIPLQQMHQCNFFYHYLQNYSLYLHLPMFLAVCICIGTENDRDIGCYGKSDEFYLQEKGVCVFKHKHYKQSFTMSGKSFHLLAEIHYCVMQC